jgi:hypothetical protein
LPESLVTGAIDEIVEKAANGDPIDWHKIDPVGFLAFAKAFYKPPCPIDMLFQKPIRLVEDEVYDNNHDVMFDKLPEIEQQVFDEPLISEDITEDANVFDPLVVTLDDLPADFNNEVEEVFQDMAHIPTGFRKELKYELEIINTIKEFDGDDEDLVDKDAGI